MLHSLLQFTPKEMTYKELLEDYIQQLIESMDYKTMECLVYVKDNLVSYTDEELITEVTEYNPELLEE